MIDPISGTFTLIGAAVKYKNYASGDDATADMRVYYAKSNLVSFYPLIFIDIDRDFTMGSKTEMYCECSATVYISKWGDTYDLPPKTQIRVKESFDDIINRSYYHRDGNGLTGKVVWELVFHRRGKIFESWNSYNESHPTLVPEWRSRVQDNTCGCPRCSSQCCIA